MNGEEEESGLITSLELPRWVMSNSNGFKLENLFQYVFLSSGRVGISDVD